LKADLLSTTLVLNAYNLMYAVILITVGRFADQYGRKRLLLIAMILFSLASLGCALAQACGRISGAPAMSWLIGFRALQGIGAAGLTPVSLAIMMVVFPRQKRGAAIGVWGAVGVWALRLALSSVAFWSKPLTGAGSSLSTCQSVQWG